MAQQNRTVDIVDIQVNYQDAVRDIATYRENVSQLQRDQERLKRELKEGKISQEDYNKAMAATNINLKNQKDAMRALEKQVLNQVRQEQRQEGSLNQLRAALSNATKAYDDMSRAERQGAKGREMLDHINKITTELKQAEEETQRYYRNVGNYPSAFSKFRESLSLNSKAFSGLGSAASSSIIGITGVVGAATALIGALKQGVTTAMSFEKSQSTLSAILNVNKKDMKELTAQARELGAQTRYTASEVTELQTELAKLGYSQTDIKNMTKDVLNFASATGAELADAAQLAGAALRMFGADTTQTQEYVDKLAASTTNSALSFPYLQTALSTVAPVANSFGFKIEDVLALLGQLANAGFDASTAATATRNILLNLADANGKLAKSLGEPVSDLDGLINGLKKLEANGIDLGEALELTDRRSVSAFSTFLKTADGAGKLRDTLNGATGACADMAKTMSDNLEGDIASLGSAWDDLMISINNGQGLLRVGVQSLTEIIRETGSALTELKSLFSDTNESVSIFGATIKGIKSSITLAIRNIQTEISAKFILVRTGWNTLINALLTPWNSFMKVLDGDIKGAFNAWSEGWNSLIENMKKGLSDYATASANAMVASKKALGNDVDVVGGIKIGTKKRIGNWICEWNGKAWHGVERVKSSTDNKTDNKTNNNTNTGDDKAEKAKRQREKLAREQRKYEDNELKAVLKYEEELTKLMGSSLEARRAQINQKYNNEIADLEKTLSQKVNLTADAEDAIRKTIELKKKEQGIELAKLEEENVRKEIDKRVELLQSELNVTQSKTYEYYNIKRSIEMQENSKRLSELETAKNEELQGIEKGSDAELEIVERYEELMQNSRILMWQNIREIDNEQQTALYENRQLALENELAELQLHNERTLELEQNLDELGLDVVTQNELDQLEKQKEIADLKLEQIREQGQLEGETMDEYRARELAAQQEQADASRAIDAAQLKNKQAYTKSMQAIGQGLISLTNAIGESDESFAKISKVITLAQIAIDTGKALSAGIASASAMPYPSNLAAIATTVATVLTNITTAITTVKSAKFATGKVNIQGAGTSTSDSIPAMISNGESVMNAKATKMFAPMLEAMNAIGNGVTLPPSVNYQQSAMTVDMMGEAFASAVKDIRPVVSVEEISDSQKRVSIIQSLDTL